MLLRERHRALLHGCLQRKAVQLQMHLLVQSITLCLVIQHTDLYCPVPRLSSLSRAGDSQKSRNQRCRNSTAISSQIPILTLLCTKIKTPKTNSVIARKTKMIGVTRKTGSIFYTVRTIQQSPKLATHLEKKRKGSRPSLHGLGMWKWRHPKEIFRENRICRYVHDRIHLCASWKMLQGDNFLQWRDHNSKTAITFTVTAWPSNKYTYTT